MRRAFLQKYELTALLAAGMMTVVVVTQLFAFERFPDVVARAYPDIHDMAQWLFVYGIVIGEVMAVAWLLPLRLRPMVRRVGAVLTWAVVTVWMALSFQGIIIASGGTALFGSYGDTLSEWGGLATVMLLAGLIAWKQWCQPK